MYIYIYTGFNLAAKLNVSGEKTCRYTWQIYSDRLLTLAGVYGFWKYVSNLDRQEIRRYLEMFYALKYRKLVSFLP